MKTLVSTRVTAATAALLASAAAALEPTEFVAGWPIEAPAGAVFDVALTPEVYMQAPVEQIAVLDAAGNPLPFFRRGAPAAEPAEQRVTLEASPLYASASTGGPAVGVTTTERGTAVTVRPGEAAEPAVTGFVLDARGIELAPIALELQWRSLARPFLLEVEIEQSEDLTSWRSVGRAAVAALSIAGAEVRHARVPVRASAGGYFRVRAGRTVEGWHVERAALVSAPAEPSRSMTLALAPLADDAVTDALPGALYFDAGGAFPVSAVALDFGDEPGWLRASVASASSLEGPWKSLAYTELFYSIEFEGEPLASAPVRISRSDERYWRVLPAEPLRGVAPRLALEYPEERLRVAARGEPPYVLAAGTLRDEAGPDSTFAAVWAELPAADVPLATLGARRELGGAAALVAPWRFPWRAATLWAVLGGGVLVVGFMAVRLAREMQGSSR